MSQVWWPTYREMPSTEAAFKAATRSLMAAVDQIEELQVRLCQSLLDFTPSPPRPSPASEPVGPSRKQDSGEAQDSTQGRQSELRFGATVGLSQSWQNLAQAVGSSGLPGGARGEGAGVPGREIGPARQEEGASGRGAEGTDAGALRERRAGPEGGPSTSAGAAEGSGSIPRGKRTQGGGSGQTPAPTREPMLMGGPFKHFLLWLLKKNKGLHRNVPPPGLSDNSVLVSVYFALLRILFEGSDVLRALGEGENAERERNGLLSRGGVRSFPAELFLRSDGHYADLSRLGGLYSHLSKEVPWVKADAQEITWVEKNGEVIPQGEDARPVPSETDESATAEPSDAMDTDERASSGSDPSPAGPADVSATSSSGIPPGASAVREAELLDVLIVLYNMGIASNFKQASHFLQNQMHNIAQLDETDRQLAAARPDQQRTLRDVRAVFVDDVAENARWSAW